jgi:hypothetical protein
MVRISIIIKDLTLVFLLMNCANVLHWPLVMNSIETNSIQKGIEDFAALV